MYLLSWAREIYLNEWNIKTKNPPFLGLSQINTFAKSKISYLCSKLFEKKVHMLITEHKDTKIQRAAQRKTLCLCVFVFHLSYRSR